MLWSHKSVAVNMSKFSSTTAQRAMRAMAAALVISAGTATMTVLPASPVHAAQIRYVVNDTPITSYDIQRRAALLKLMRRSGNLQQLAADEMIDQTLRRQAMAENRVNITDEMVSESYANFAKGNKLSLKQLDQILAQSGVTKDHFREFIRTQMGWGRVLQTKARSSIQLSQEDVVRKMLEEGRQPSTTEYMLQQVIFVVPSAERGKILGKRKREAEAMRGRVQGCSNLIDLAKTQLDVTVRDLGRVLQPELPPDWKDHIVKTSPGKPTPVRETERGVEFITVCNSREVSDDHVAKLVFQSEQTEDKSFEALSKQTLEELRKEAKIVKR